MSDTTFSSGTVIASTWLNDVNDRVYTDAVNVQNAPYGALADGITDNTTAFQTAINTGKTVIIPEGTYKINGNLTLVSNVKLKGVSKKSILDFSGTSGSTSFMTATGTLATGTLTNSTVTKFAASVNSNGHGLVVGDWFRIVSTVDANSVAAGVDRLGARADVVYLTETHQVQSVADVNNFTIRGAFRFGYPSGSSVYKINSVNNIEISDLTILAGSRAVRPIEITLGKTAVISNITIDNAAGEILYRGCFDGSAMHRVRAYAVANTSTATNTQLIKVVDGCFGVMVKDIDLANGGQVIDITYTPGGSLCAPTLDTTIDGGTIHSTYNSAIVDHPTCDGTVIKNIQMWDVKGAVFIRSRNALVDGVTAWGTYDATNGNGIWAGEDGYWSGLTVSNCKMYNFDVGYQFAGSASTIERRDTTLTNNYSQYCRVGERFGSVNTPLGCGVTVLGSRIVSPIETGIQIAGNWVGLINKDFVIRGTVTNEAIEIDASLASGILEGALINIGNGIPGIRVISGTPTSLTTNLIRTGDCGQNVGLTRSMCSPVRKLVATRVGSFSHTGNTNKTNLITTWITIPEGAFNEQASLVVKFRGTFTGSAGTKTFRLETPGGDILSNDIVLPAAANGSFEVKAVIDGTANATQNAYASWLADGVSAQDPSGATARAITVADGFSLNLNVQLGSAADTATVTSAEAYFFSG